MKKKLTWIRKNWFRYPLCDHQIFLLGHFICRSLWLTPSLCSTFGMTICRLSFLFTFGKGPFGWDITMLVFLLPSFKDLVATTFATIVKNLKTKIKKLTQSSHLINQEEKWVKFLRVLRNHTHPPRGVSILHHNKGERITCS